MEKQDQKQLTVDDYVKSLTPPQRKVLQQFRKLMKELVPGVIERMSYNMPGFEYQGTLLWFAAFKAHYGFFPYPKTIVQFKDELKDYKTSKGTIQFPADEPLPVPLIKKIVKFRLKENLAKIQLKKK
jgi:uncharacterized protein YdhG (YjbR/CyaY superfamily)